MVKARRARARAYWSDGDILLLMRAAGSPAVQTARWMRAVLRWHRAVSKRRRPGAARAELRGAAFTVCKRARQIDEGA